MNIPIEIIEVESAGIEIIEVESTGFEVIEVESAGIGSSLFQSFQDYLTLDGGRPSDIFTGITPLDGGEV